jgi:hypothetical protein
MVFLLPLVQLAVTAVSKTIAGRLAVLALWEIARRTPGTVDDEAIKALAVSLGVALPPAPKAVTKPPPTRL